MTIKQCIKTKWINYELSGDLLVYQTVDVNFINSDGLIDETQFDVRYVDSIEGQNELTELFQDFCKDNGYKTNTVTEISIVKVARTRAELELEWSNRKYYERNVLWDKKDMSIRNRWLLCV